MKYNEKQLQKLGCTTEQLRSTIVESPDARVIEIITSLEKQVAALRTEIGAMATTIAMMAQVMSKNTK